jgi:hypothetical protein
MDPTSVILIQDVLLFLIFKIILDIQVLNIQSMFRPVLLSSECGRTCRDTIVSTQRGLWRVAGNMD